MKVLLFLITLMKLAVVLCKIFSLFNYCESCSFILLCLGRLKNYLNAKMCVLEQ